MYGRRLWETFLCMATYRTGCCGIGSRRQKSPRGKTEPKATHGAHEFTTVEWSHVFWASLGSQQGSVPFGKQLHESRSNTCLLSLQKGMTSLIKFTHFFQQWKVPHTCQSQTHFLVSWPHLKQPPLLLKRLHCVNKCEKGFIFLLMTWNNTGCFLGS